MAREKNKVCSKCNKKRPLLEFLRGKAYKDGYRSVCKECRKAYDKRYYQNNRESILERKVEYQRKHPEIHRERQRKWRKGNKKRKKYILEKVKKWQKNNPEKVKAQNYTYYHREELMEDKCEVCGINKELVTHHPNYKKLKWIITLCPVHHREIHMLDSLH